MCIKKTTVRLDAELHHWDLGPSDLTAQENKDREMQMLSAEWKVLMLLYDCIQFDMTQGLFIKVFRIYSMDQHIFFFIIHSKSDCIGLHTCTVHSAIASSLQKWPHPR